MRVWRVILDTEDVQVPGDDAPFAGIQHVAFVVSPDIATIPRVLLADPGIAAARKSSSVRAWVPRVMEELDTSKPLWCCKIGPDPDDASIFVCVGAERPEQVPLELTLLHRDNPGILEMLANGWYRVAPRPIDTSVPGVW